jgi:4a-hydroxytetrahydrobiopterin dehydratase
MTAAELRAKRCLPCEGGVPRLDAGQIGALLPQVPGWEERDQRLHRRFTFRDFVTAMRFVNRMAEVAESEGHHPDFTVHYRQVDVEIWTHAIGGISENDFILAAKIAPLAEGL